MEIFTQEEVDAIITAEIFRVNPKNGVREPKQKVSWREEAIHLRRREIMKLFGKGMTRMSIMDEIMARWGCKKTAAHNYVVDAMDYIVELNKEDADKLKDVIMHKLDSLAEESLQNRDRKSALKAYDQISKLAGLYEEKVKVEADTEIRFNFGE